MRPSGAAGAVRGRLPVDAGEAWLSVAAGGGDKPDHKEALRELEKAGLEAADTSFRWAGGGGVGRRLDGRCNPGTLDISGNFGSTTSNRSFHKK